jgi:hypothetical protein
VSLRLSGLPVRPKVLFTDSACVLSALHQSFPACTYDHHGCWHIGLAVPHRPQTLEHVHQRRIVFGWLIDQSREANCAILPLDVEVVLEGNRQAMQRSDGLAGSLEVFVEGFCLLDCFIKECVAETIGLHIN